MADFLIRLAARTIGVAPTIQPRIASLYEPAQARGMSDAEEFPLVHHADRYASKRPLLFSPLEPVGQANKEMNPTVSDRRGGDEGKALSPGGDASQGDARETLAGNEGASPPEFPPRRVRDEAPAPTSLPQKTDAHLVVGRVSRGVEDTQMLQEEMGGDEALPSSLRGGASRGDVREALAGGRGDAHESLIGSGETSPPGFPPHRAVASPPAPPPPPPTSPRQRTDAHPVIGRVNRGVGDTQTLQEGASPVPTVQITIGRIEVKATPAPATRPQNSRSGPPVMGLEEYLKQRAGGDR